MDDEKFDQIKIDNIKKFVDVELERQGLYNKIKDFVEMDDDEERLMDKIRETCLIDEIMENFKNTNVNDIPDSSKKCLYMKLTNGRGFVDYVGSSMESAYFRFDILFLGQRFQSKKIRVSSDFLIEQSFILDFNPLKLDLEVDFERLKRLSSPIHIVMILIQGDTVKLVGTKMIEWRWALCYGSWKIDAELYSSAVTNKLNVGSIEVQLSLLPHIDKTKLLTEKTIFEHLNGEKRYETECKI
jgi:hypothetical protein